MKLERPGIIKGESAREYASRVLKFNILNLYLPPGQPISENEIAESLNISRTPVREAFIRLAEADLIEIYPQKGTYVSKINLENVEEGWFARITLESAVVKLICENPVNEALIRDLEENLHMLKYYIDTGELFKIISMDEAYHRILYGACNKERICAAIESLNFDYYRTRIISLAHGIKPEEVFTQHTEIKNSIKERDGLKARKAVESHLNSVKVDEEILKNKHPEFVK